MRVLVADDSVAVRHHIASMLEATGHVEFVAEAADVPTVMMAIRRHRPQVVVLDINMPGGNGIEVLHEIKREFDGTHVIMLTNHANPFYRKSCLEAGAAHFFDKSLEFESVADVVVDLARRNGNRAG